MHKSACANPELEYIGWKNATPSSLKGTSSFINLLPVKSPSYTISTGLRKAPRHHRRTSLVAFGSSGPTSTTGEHLWWLLGAQVQLPPQVLNLWLIKTVSSKSMVRESGPYTLFGPSAKNVRQRQWAWFCFSFLVLSRDTFLHLYLWCKPHCIQCNLWDGVRRTRGIFWSMVKTGLNFGHTFAVFQGICLCKWECVFKWCTVDCECP